MTLVKVKERQVASIPFLHRLALKLIFNKKGMTKEEEYLIEHSIEYWPKKVGFGAEERKELKFIVQALIDNEDGKWDRMKKLIIKHKLDYRKVYRETVA